ncbi:lipoprotein [Candidatus Woesearchaeota archaeon]|nr:lipoprotein [Candidatus Woesearchaeota archaeon]MBW2978964.1 lipoprotein [Candidatus Woesearchaeota archaeon]
MKKILFAILVLFLLTACSIQQKTEINFPDKKSEKTVSSEKESSFLEQESYVPKEPKTIDGMMPEERTRLAEHQSTDLEKAFDEGMKLCNYKLNDVLVRAWILNKDRFRIETAVPGTRISTVYDMDMVYSWDDRTKQGVKIKISDLPTKQGERVAGIEIPKTPEQVMASDVDVVCVKSTAIGEDILDIPDIVEFTDVTEIIKD